MTREQKEDLLKSEISSELFEQIDRYVKEIENLLIGSKREKENWIGMVCIDIMEFLNENPNAGMTDIVAGLGTPEKIANEYLESKSEEEPEKIRKSMSVRKALVIAAIVAVTIIGIIYAGAFILQNQDAPGYYRLEESYENVDYEVNSD